MGSTLVATPPERCFAERAVRMWPTRRCWWTFSVGRATKRESLLIRVPQLAHLWPRECWSSFSTPVATMQDCHLYHPLRARLHPSTALLTDGSLLVVVSCCWFLLLFVDRCVAECRMGRFFVRPSSCLGQCSPHLRLKGYRIILNPRS